MVRVPLRLQTDDEAKWEVAASLNYHNTVVPFTADTSLSLNYSCPQLLTRPIEHTKFSHADNNQVSDGCNKKLAS
ncbi:unnamed protein product [Protopolystoma xenopodis]|uniref:Uncharacterized protein n=1 Tax=Protopolystoma xenopodis TaxID=117903 RepID=A0A448XD65_9PLAT|nr:unnamed protein product [Protopolystoma xenopodis]